MSLPPENEILRKTKFWSLPSIYEWISCHKGHHSGLGWPWLRLGDWANSHVVFKEHRWTYLWKWHARASKSSLDNVCSNISSIQLWQCGILQTLCLQEMNRTKRQRYHEWRETRLAKLSTKLEINTNTDVNVQDLFSAGKETVTQMEGQAIFLTPTNGRLK